jgi:osmotically inducible protein OsmC
MTESPSLLTTRTARGVWEGSLADGAGSVEMVSSGISTYAVSWAGRTNRAAVQTSPEELIAAAQATCFNMALAQQLLSVSGKSAKFLETTVDVSFDAAAGVITQIALNVRAVIDGLDDAEFANIAAEAKANCPVARALTGTEIVLNTNLVERSAAPSSGMRAA